MSGWPVPNGVISALKVAHLISCCPTSPSHRGRRASHAQEKRRGTAMFFANAKLARDSAKAHSGKCVWL